MSQVRNIFDQYSQDENRLTHALACALASDRRATYEFLKRFANLKNLRKFGPLRIEEQATHKIEHDRVGRIKTIPDLLIADREDHLGIIVEAKVKAVTDTKQLHRHMHGLQSLGYEVKRALLISVDGKLRIPNPNFIGISWKNVYEWAGDQKRTADSLVEEFRRYMEVFEANAGNDGDYLAMTGFSGVYFDRENPYREADAKARLRALMAALREERGALKRIGADPDKEGRGAIKGNWDLIPLKASRKSGHTGMPHLTVSLDPSRLAAQLTIPDKVERSRRNAIRSLSYQKFQDIIAQVENKLSKALKPYPGAFPYLEMLQRYYPTQSSVPIKHAFLLFDLRTAVVGKVRGKGHPKIQPQWMKASFEAFRDKKSNLQMAVGAQFPYSKNGTGRKALVGGILNVFEGLRPLIKVLE